MYRELERERENCIYLHLKKVKKSKKSYQEISTDFLFTYLFIFG